ncbi:MAG: rRNA methyltransferase [Rhodospirillaceae bacterium]|jgi:tRNA/rRNA methyltransferase|nr:rRNA methyltransferase [Rhodospirillaceae bacterium]|tara:strand:+ start:2179 stop:2988 length:810 start_codon:yes stop_codon:yes gene_type:complete
MAGDGAPETPAPGGDAPGPVIVLVEPQLGENIGMAARAMLNCRLTELRLVKPRDGWPSPEATAAAAGADRVVGGASVYDSTADAVSDLERVFATTARARDMTQRILTPRQAGAEIRDFMAGGRSGGQGDIRAGVLFGGEAKGLKNDDLALCDAVVMAPVNPAFSSLNLAQAVFCIGYEWLLAGPGNGEDGGGGRLAMAKETRPANKAELQRLFEHLEEELDASGFLHVKEKRPVMVRNIRNMLQRAHLTEQEVRTLRGIIASLSGRRGT